MSTFWDDLAADIEDPEYAEEHVAAAELIETLDGIANDTETRDPAPD